jgi:hypothetical protein
MRLGFRLKWNLLQKKIRWRRNTSSAGFSLNPRNREGTKGNYPVVLIGISCQTLISFKRKYGLRSAFNAGTKRLSANWTRGLLPRNQVSLISSCASRFISHGLSSISCFTRFYLDVCLLLFLLKSHTSSVSAWPLEARYVLLIVYPKCIKSKDFVEGLSVCLSVCLSVVYPPSCFTSEATRLISVTFNIEYIPWKSNIKWIQGEGCCRRLVYTYFARAVIAQSV